MDKWLVSGFYEPQKVKVFQFEGKTYIQYEDENYFNPIEERDLLFDTEEEAEAYRNNLLKIYTDDKFKQAIEYFIDEEKWDMFPEFVKERCNMGYKYFSYSEKEAIESALKGNICIDATSFNKSQVSRVCYGKENVKVVLSDGTELMTNSEVEKFIIESIFGQNKSVRMFTSF